MPYKYKNDFYHDLNNVAEAIMKHHNNSLSDEELGDRLQWDVEEYTYTELPFGTVFQDEGDSGWTPESETNDGDDDWENDDDEDDDCDDDEDWGL